MTMTTSRTNRILVAALLVFATSGPAEAQAPIKIGVVQGITGAFEVYAKQMVTGFRMGLEHGLWCLGCCWFLMVLLFFGGVMNLFWIAGLALYVLLEKTLPYGHWLGRAAGVALLAAGATLALA